MSAKHDKGGVRYALKKASREAWETELKRRVDEMDSAYREQVERWHLLTWGTVVDWRKEQE